MAVEEAESLRDVLDHGGGPAVHGGDGQQRVTQVADDGRMPLALLHLVLEGVEHGGECTETLKLEATEPLLELGDPGHSLLVVLVGDWHAR